MAALDGARVDLFLVTSPPTMLSQYLTALPTPDPSALPTPAPQTPGQDAASPALYSRLYDTGDWGRLRPDGTLEILIDS